MTTQRNFVAKSLVVLCLLIGTTVATGGCGQSAAMAYYLGIGRNRKIEPLFVLPPGKILVLVDDTDNRVTWPRARDLLAESVGRELLAHEAAESIISNTSLMQLRQVDPAFPRYSATKIGRKLGANTVIWLQIKDFFAPTEIEDTSSAARLTLSIKILNADEMDDPSDVRLWPADERGHINKTELSAIEVERLKGSNASARALAEKAAKPIGRLFYEHTLGDLDNDRFE